jgi:GNAT superfamily N-acetyltransferase
VNTQNNAMWETKNLVQEDVKLISPLQPDGWLDITPTIEFYTRSSFCFPMKVIFGNEIAGIGTAIIHHDVAWLAHIIVHKDFRRKGIGRFITQSLVNHTEVKKCETIYLLATELGAPVYEKVGFETESEYLFFKDVRIEKLSNASAHIKPYEAKFKTQVAEMDKMSSGEDRIFHLQDHLSNGYVYGSDEIIEGFYLPTLGDGLIIGVTSSAGIKLLNFHLHSHEKVVLPNENLVAINYLHENGFKEFSTGKRMRLGKKRPVKLENIYNRIGGNLG